MLLRVLIADDHTLVRESLVSLLQAGGDVQVVAQASSGVETVEKAIATRPDVVVTDLSMPGLGGIEVVRRLHEAVPETRVLVLTMHQEDEYVLQAVRAGASGYLVKDSAAAELVAAVRSLQAGRGYFGPQASRALAEQSSGADQIAAETGRLTTMIAGVSQAMAEQAGATSQIAAAAGDMRRQSDQASRGIAEQSRAAADIGQALVVDLDR